MAARRALTLALPASDPRSAQIWAYLEVLEPDADSSAELRRLICEALDAGARMARIEGKLDKILAGGGALAPQAEALDVATVDALLDFGV
jgi:hypothetical protein